MSYEPHPLTLAPLDAVTHRAPQDGKFTFTTASTITASGFPWDLSDLVAKVLWVGRKAAAGTSWVWYVEGRQNVSFYFSATNVLTITGAAPFVAGDSYMAGVVLFDKAMVGATNSLRIGETNHLSAQYANEPGLVNEAIVANTVLYWPSIAGCPMAGFKDDDILAYLVGGKDVGVNDLQMVMTVEATNDFSTGGIHPIWAPVTPSVYNQSTNSVGVASFISTGNVALIAAISLDNLNMALFRLVFTPSGVPVVGNPAKVCVYNRRKAL